MPQTDVSEFMNDLDGGVFADKVSRVLSDVAGAVHDNEKKGQVSITLDFKKVGSAQVLCSHKVAFTKPTLRGQAKEEDTTTTPMHVGPGGKMTFFPQNQDTLFKDQEA